jgi:hypothetical protein
MEELIKLVAKQAGLSDDMAKKGVEMVAGFLQGQLPPAASGKIGEVLGAMPSTVAAEVKTPEDLIKLISRSFGVPEQTGQTVLNTVVGFLKTKLPEPFPGLIDMLLSDGGTAGGGAILEDLLGGMRGQ